MYFNRDRSQFSTKDSLDCRIWSFSRSTKKMMVHKGGFYIPHCKQIQDRKWKNKGLFEIHFLSYSY